MIASEGRESDVLSPAQVRNFILVEETALLRAFVSLENGVHCSYPGLGGFPPDYDGRKRPKYVLAARTRGIHWGNSFPDQFGHGLVLPSSTALYDASGRFVGVAGVEMAFDFIVGKLLPLPGVPAVVETFLVDEEGRVVVRSGEQRYGDARTDMTRAGDMHNDQPIALAPLPYPGMEELHGAGRRSVGGGRMAVFYPLAALGWHYVVIVDEQKLFGRDQE
jgi:hypothetical protein